MSSEGVMADPNVRRVIDVRSGEFVGTILIPAWGGGRKLAVVRILRQHRMGGSLQ